MQFAPYRESLSRLLVGRELTGPPFYLLTYSSLFLFYLTAMHAGSIWVPLQFVGATAGERVCGRLAGVLQRMAGLWRLGSFVDATKEHPSPNLFSSAPHPHRPQEHLSRSSSPHGLRWRRWRGATPPPSPPPATGAGTPGRWQPLEWLKRLRASRACSSLRRNSPAGAATVRRRRSCISSS